jgi:secreted trypsin-like serine protease
MACRHKIRLAPVNHVYQVAADDSSLNEHGLFRFRLMARLKFSPPSFRILLLAWGIITSSSLHAATIIDSIDPQQYRDEASLYPSVAKLTGAIFGGSGVVISDRWVLTAGHIALGKTGGTVTVGGNSYTVQSSIVHPNYSYPSNPNDIGLLYLSSSISGVAPAKMLKLDGPLSILGREATWVGHGLGGNGVFGAAGPLDFRAFTNIIDVMGPAYGLTDTAFVSDFDNPDGSTTTSGSDPTATRLEGNVASGDSGGGVFITVDGVRYLVGISSFTGGFVAGANSKYGSISGATNLQLFHDWIADETGVTAIPEPGVFGLCLITAGLALLPRRRAAK